VNEAPEPLSRVNPSVQAELESVVMRALQKDPDARFPTADTFREAVTAAAEGEATEPLGGDTAVLPVATRHLEPPSGRRRGLLAAAALAVVVAIVGISALALTGDDRPERRGDRPRGTPAEEAPTTAPAEVDLAAATVAFQELVEGAFAAGELEEDLAGRILDEAEKALEEHSKGETEKAFEHLGKIETEVQVGLLDGTVASEQTAELLLRAVATLRTAMSEEPVVPTTPPEENQGDGEEDGDSGPGNSENAPGQIRKDDDD
jgi:hypothetical protein